MKQTQKTLTQQDMLAMFEPVFKTESKKYRKEKGVLVRKALAGEVIKTVTSDGLETSNTAGKDDFIIKNLTEAEEEYIISKKKLAERYALVEKKDATYSLYEPTGTINALKLTEGLIKKLGLNESFWFVASWGEKMVARKSDFLVLTKEKEIYRIARKEFFETYELC